MYIEYVFSWSIYTAHECNQVSQVQTLQVFKCTWCQCMFNKVYFIFLFKVWTTGNVKNSSICESCKVWTNVASFSLRVSLMLYLWMWCLKSSFHCPLCSYSGHCSPQSNVFFWQCLNTMNVLCSCNPLIQSLRRTWTGVPSEMLD